MHAGEPSQLGWRAAGPALPPPTSTRAVVRRPHGITRAGPACGGTAALPRAPPPPGEHAAFLQQAALPRAPPPPAPPPPAARRTRSPPFARTSPAARRRRRRRRHPPPPRPLRGGLVRCGSRSPCSSSAARGHGRALGSAKGPAPAPRESPPVHTTRAAPVTRRARHAPAAREKRLPRADACGAVLRHLMCGKEEKRQVEARRKMIAAGARTSQHALRRTHRCCTWSMRSLNIKGRCHA
jgi:hypothetical protein